MLRSENLVGNEASVAVATCSRHGRFLGLAGSVVVADGRSIVDLIAGPPRPLHCTLNC